VLRDRRATQYDSKISDKIIQYLIGGAIKPANSFILSKQASIDKKYLKYCQKCELLVKYNKKSTERK
jgi:hypothetical protein